MPVVVRLAIAAVAVTVTMTVMVGCASAGDSSYVTLGLGQPGSDGDDGSSTTSAASGDDAATTGSSATSLGESGVTFSPADSSSGPSEGSTTGPSEELCDGVDNDGDGLIDEVSPRYASCSGCAVFQSVEFAYWVCDARVGWTAAHDACVALGADLASIHSDADNALLKRYLLGREDGIWIGGRDEITEDTWLWSDGTAWDYPADWGEGEPNNFNGVEHWLELNGNMNAWADRREDFNDRYACKAPHSL